MLFELPHVVSHADVDFLGEMKVSALLGLLEQSAIEASVAAGYDAARYAAERGVWIIRRTWLERRIPVGGTDRLIVETGVEDFRRARSLRRYVVRRGEVVTGEAVTDWVYCDTDTGRPMRVPESLAIALAGGQERPALPRRPDAEPQPDGPPHETTIEIRPSHLDHVGHVNNGRWLDFLEDAALHALGDAGWPLAGMRALGGALRLRSLDCEYYREARIGDVLQLRTWLTGPVEVADGRPRQAGLWQTVSDGEGAKLVAIRSEWGWRHTSPILGGVPTAA